MESGGSVFKRLSTVLILAGGCLILILFMWPQLMPTMGKHGRVVASTLANQWALSKVIHTYEEAWESAQTKVRELRQAEEENSKLRMENAYLKYGLETLQMGCQLSHGSQSTQKFEHKLSKETGTHVGRTLASIPYKAPTKLLPSQLYTLGVSYMKGREGEKAAVIFSTLMSLEEVDTYRTPKNLLATGLIWYRLDNYVLADSYFDEVLKKPSTEDALQYQAQARLWKALVAKKLNKEVKSQYWLRDLVDHHPQSSEAEWINSRSSLNSNHSPGKQHAQHH